MDRLSAHALPPPDGYFSAHREIFKSLEDGYFLGYVPRNVALVCVGENPLSVAWHMPINKKPFLYGIAIAEENYSHTLIEEGKDFTINFLSFEFLEDILIAGKYHGNEHEKWKPFKRIKPIKALRVNAYMVDTALLVYECKQERFLEFEDHSLIIGKVEAIHYRRGKLKPHKVKYPLNMGKGYFSRNSRVYIYKR